MDRMTWDEIRDSFPEEYVLLVDAERDSEGGQIVAGVVVGHSIDRKNLLESTKESVSGRSRVLRWTGDVGKGNYLL